MYVEELLQLIQDLPCDKGNKVFIGTGVRGNILKKDNVYVDRKGDLHIDAAYN